MWSVQAKSCLLSRYTPIGVDRLIWSFLPFVLFPWDVAQGGYQPPYSHAVLPVLGAHCVHVRLGKGIQYQKAPRDEAIRPQPIQRFKWYIAVGGPFPSTSPHLADGYVGRGRAQHRAALDHSRLGRRRGLVFERTEKRHLLLVAICAVAFRKGLSAVSSRHRVSAG